jgi:hypothetical protein
MKRMVWPALAAMLAFVPVGCATQTSQAEDDIPVKIDTAADITALLLGKTVYGRYADGTPWIEFHTKDGVSAYRISQFSCPARWEVSGNVLCSSTEDFEPTCFNLWRAGSKVLFVIVGEDPKAKDVLVADRLVEGDPEGLLADSPACPE